MAGLIGKGGNKHYPQPINIEDEDQDLETGNFIQERARNNRVEGAAGETGSNEEYRSLIRYIDTYRDPNADVEETEAPTSKKVPKWMFWKKATVEGAGSSGFVTPADWLKTDMRQGLDPTEVERRRKYTGWNELTTEKENMFLKFVGFFRGPILYGKHKPAATCRSMTAMKLRAKR
ncbi:putative plasma-membrane proton-efflux P-type ATPase [Colletotrichum sublineola]|uniref:Putative plasma-membrane proton-efflux P-type ATPase n=1 Tax=Colletotrichum sublineola TaxID=1173701 RepID=A0A066XLL1_COLSU|nr:putative plasma-membrane proton-efflux P-type ATPase [Colletotrichum sublineola]